MRQKIVAGNWKCNTTVQEGIELAKAVNDLVVNIAPTLMEKITKSNLAALMTVNSTTAQPMELTKK